MGLDSCVKKYLRQHCPDSFSYCKSLQDVYKNDFNAMIVDMNVELFKKPSTVTTGLEWAKYIYYNRIKNPKINIIVLLFDSSGLVPAVKDACHLQRSSTKRKRGFIPLPKETMFGDNIALPDWGRLTGTKGLLPKVWHYLLTALSKLINKDMDFEKTVYFDTPLCPKIPNVELLSGKIKLVWRGDKSAPTPGPPVHRYGESDLKTLAWTNHLTTKWNLDKILVLSTDLDNIPMFSRPQYKGVFFMGNTVFRNEMGVVVPKPRNTKPSLVYELICLGNIATSMGAHWSLFIDLLALSKNDFNTNVHKMTTERMIKTFFFCKKRKSVNPGATLFANILTSKSQYMKFVQLCQSKAVHSRKSNLPKCTSSQVDGYLSRAQWVRSYWDGEEAYKGGPDCMTSPGWKVPTQGSDLHEYAGKVRLVPA